MERTGTATEPCTNCKGTGLVARPYVGIAEGDHTRRFVKSMFEKEICSKCDGGGVVKFDSTKVRETPPVFDCG
jgi:RecJ-like exonuclease